MNITERKILKKWENSQTSLITNNDGKKFIEKVEYQYNQNGVSFLYGSNELEIYENILVPLDIEHVCVADSIREHNQCIFILEYIDGLTCSDYPHKNHLYRATEKAGAIYSKSIQNISRIDRKYIDKYTLSKEMMYSHLNAISDTFNTSELYGIIDSIFSKYENNHSFVNHFDMHFKNFICKDDNFYLIDWATTQISPFYTDLYVLLSQAEEVNADYSKIVNIYKKSSGIFNIKKKEILEGGICWIIPNLHWLVDLAGTSDAPFLEWAEDEYQSLSAILDEYRRL